MKRIVMMLTVALVMAAMLVAMAMPAFAAPSDSGGCPGVVNPQGHFCGNPHELAGAGAPPLPSCNSPNAFKNSDVCRGELS